MQFQTPVYVYIDFNLKKKNVLYRELNKADYLSPQRLAWNVISSSGNSLVQIGQTTWNLKESRSMLQATETKITGAKGN